MPYDSEGNEVKIIGRNSLGGYVVEINGVRQTVPPSFVRDLSNRPPQSSLEDFASLNPFEEAYRKAHPNEVRESQLQTSSIDNPYIQSVFSHLKSVPKEVDASSIVTAAQNIQVQSIEKTGKTPEVRNAAIEKVVESGEPQYYLIINQPSKAEKMLEKAVNQPNVSFEKSLAPSGIGGRTATFGETSGKYIMQTTKLPKEPTLVSPIDAVKHQQVIEKIQEYQPYVINKETIKNAAVETFFPYNEKWYGKSLPERVESFANSALAWYGVLSVGSSIASAVGKKPLTRMIDRSTVVVEKNLGGVSIGKSIGKYGDEAIKVRYAVAGENIMQAQDVTKVAGTVSFEGKYIKPSRFGFKKVTEVSGEIPFGSYVRKLSAEEAEKLGVNEAYSYILKTYPGENTIEKGVVRIFGTIPGKEGQIVIEQKPFPQVSKLYKGYSFGDIIGEGSSSATLGRFESYAIKVETNIEKIRPHRWLKAGKIKTPPISDEEKARLLNAFFGSLERGESSNIMKGIDAGKGLKYVVNTGKISEATGTNDALTSGVVIGKRIAEHVVSSFGKEMPNPLDISMGASLPGFGMFKSFISQGKGTSHFPKIFGRSKNNQEIIFSPESSFKSKISIFSFQENKNRISQKIDTGIDTGVKTGIDVGVGSSLDTKIGSKLNEIAQPITEPSNVPLPAPKIPIRKNFFKPPRIPKLGSVGWISGRKRRGKSRRKYRYRPDMLSAWLGIKSTDLKLTKKIYTGFELRPII